MRRYGLTAAAFEAMHAEQNGVCAICKRPPAKETMRNGVIRERLNVDHCHASGRVRGLLCAACNKAVGYLADSPALARAIAEYLEKVSKHGE